MSLKKRLTMGAMSATLGLSLVAGGTWAAFNDVEQVNASVGAGKLNLDLQKNGTKPFTFKISNLKPGDHMTRDIKLVNTGTLAIKDVLVAMESVSFTEYTPGTAGANDTDTWGINGALEYLDQFRVSIVKVGAEGGAGGFPHDLIPASENLTLKDFYLASSSVLGNTEKMSYGADQTAINQAKNDVWNAVDNNYITDYRLNVATINPDEWTGLPVVPKDDDIVRIKIEFVDEKVDSNGDGTWDQNTFQGDTADITFSFEARQWGGQEVTDDDIGNGRRGNASDGYVETNERANNGE
jgi:spore coat-associated protein N